MLFTYSTYLCFFWKMFSDKKAARRAAKAKKAEPGSAGTPGTTPTQKEALKTD